MKALLISCFVAFAAISYSNAQKAITIEEKNLSFKHGTINGFIVSIPEVPLKTVEEKWISSIQKGTKSKVQKEYGEMTIFGAIIKDVAGGPINIYSYIKQKDSIVYLAASFELKKDEYINSETRDYEASKAKSYLFQFAKDNYLDLAKNQLQTEEKKLNKLESNLNSLQNEKNKLEKTILSDTSEIIATKSELKSSGQNLQSLNDELKAQKNQVDTMSAGPAKEEKTKYIADLEKRINKTKTSISSGEKKLVELQSEIKQAQNEGIPKNNLEQEKVKKEIIAKKEVVRIMTNKYNTIKAFTM